MLQLTASKTGASVGSRISLLFSTADAGHSRFVNGTYLKKSTGIATGDGPSGANESDRTYFLLGSSLDIGDWKKMFASKLYKLSFQTSIKI